MAEVDNTATNAAELERTRLTSLINSMADGVIAIDDQMNVVVYNGAALNILDVNATIAGNPITGILRLQDKDGQNVDALALIRAQKTPYTSRDLSIHYADGSSIKLYLSIAPVHLGYGEHGSRGYVLLMRDITREKSLEEERDEFISVASHELRTPVAIAEGNVSNARLILQRGGDPKAIDQALSQAYEQVVFLSGLINDLATLSRAEGGRLKVEVEDINAHQLVEDLVKTYTQEAQAKGLKVIAHVDPTLEILHSTELYVREILQNFITNAIKYTDKGFVTVGARPAQGGIEFWVEDTGIGISKPDQEKVFNKFFRSEDYRTRQNKGTGLGLYVTAKLARLISATINLTSELNKGSKFIIYVPNLVKAPEEQVDAKANMR